jgi:hypothetical protein
VLVFCCSLVDRSFSLKSNAKRSCQSNLDQETKGRLLSFHNDARQLADASSLEWDNDLQCTSQEWANRCEFVHSKSAATGENIGCGYGNGYEPLTALKDWWNEFVSDSDEG